MAAKKQTVELEAPKAAPKKKNTATVDRIHKMNDHEITDLGNKIRTASHQITEPRSLALEIALYIDQL